MVLMTSDLRNGRRASFYEKVRYRFDTIMARGALGQIVLLLVMGFFFFLFIVIASLLMYHIFVGNPNFDTITDIFARTFMLILVPDPVDLSDGGLVYFSALLAIIAGLFVGGTLIGILSTAINDRMDQLRRGRSFVAEEKHTVILGWSSKIFRIVSEIVIANENHQGQCIAILANRDPVEMEIELRERIGDYRGTIVVCRRGKPIVTQDMELVNVVAARSVIVLSPDDRREPDSHVIKILLTAVKIMSHRKEKLPFVVELIDRRNVEICRISTKNSPIELVTVLPEVLIPRLLVQSCRKRGLSNVYLEIFDFDGDEIYFQKMENYPHLIGKSFKDILFGFDTSSIIGIADPQGNVILNPPSDMTCTAEHEILSITQDDDTTIASHFETFKIYEDAIVVEKSEFVPKPERNLIIGWNRFAGTVISELDNYVQSGSKLTIACSFPEEEETLKNLHGKVKNHELHHINGDTVCRRFLESLDYSSYDNILILPFNPEASDEQEDVDANTITTLVYVRNIEQERGLDLSITTEMLLEESRAVADMGVFGDFVVGDEIIGRIIAQLAEESRLQEVFRILLTVEGNEIHIKPITHFVKTGMEVNGYTLLEAARRKNQIYIGYIKGHDIVINASKPETVSFDENDKIIVVAHD